MIRLCQSKPNGGSPPIHLPLVALVLLAAVGGMFTRASAARGQDTIPPPALQNPSPMVEATRSHARVPEQDLPGFSQVVDVGLSNAARLFVPEGTDLSREVRLLVHFHGPAFLPEYAISRSGDNYVAATVNVAPGSEAYDVAFSDPAVFDSLLIASRRALIETAAAPVAFANITLSGFSAGHGAIRAILRHPAHFKAVDAVLLLDGLHTGYIPSGTVLHHGGRLDTTKLKSVLRFSRAAARGEKRLLITHSEIFPGTFASTTETTDHLLAKLGFHRKAILHWGPVGMQQLSEVRCRGLEVRGYAGNSAPDHTDHIHGIARFLDVLDDLGPDGSADADKNHRCSVSTERPRADRLRNGS